MPQLKATIILELDGMEVAGTPWIRRYVLTEAQAQEIQKAADNNTTSFSQFPGSVSATLQCFAMTADEATNLKFNNGGALPMNANGIVVILGANIASGISTNATINNPAASQAANIQAVVGGS